MNKLIQATAARGDLLGILVVIGSAIVFGLYPPAARGVYADGGNAVFVILITITMRALALTVFCGVTRKALFKKAEDTKFAMICGVLQSLSVIGIFGALVFLPGPLVIIIVFTHTLMLLFFMAWRGEMKLDRLTILLTVMALTGLGLVLNVWNPDYLYASLAGIALAFMTALATGARTYLYGQLTRERNPAVVGAETFIFAALFTLAILFWDMPQLPVSAAGHGWAALACLSLVLGTFGMFYGIALLGAFRWSLFLKLEPVFTALFSAILLHEFLNWHQYVGMMIVISSLAAYQYVEHRNIKFEKIG